MKNEVLSCIFEAWASSQCARARHAGRFEALVEGTVKWLQSYNYECKQSKNKLCVVFRNENAKLFVKPTKFGMMLISGSGEIQYYPIDNVGVMQILDGQISKIFLEKTYQEDVSFEAIVEVCEESGFNYDIKKCRKWNRNINYVTVANYGNIFFNKKSITVCYFDHNETKTLFK